MSDYVSEWASAADSAANAIAQLGAQIGGIKAQKEANAANLQMNALTNATNREIANLNNAEAVRLWEIQSRYNSPAHQVALLGEAGFTPNALLGSQGFNKTFGAGAPPQLQRPDLTPGHVEPVTYGADAALSLGDRLSQFMVNLSSAKKLQSETVGQDLANESYSKQVAAQLRALGASSEAQEIENKYKSQKESEELRNLRTLGYIQEQQYRQLMLANNLTSIFGEDRMKAEINEIVQRAFALEQQGNTEESKRLLNAALTDKAKSDVERNAVQSAVDRYLAPYQAGLMGAQAGEAGARTLNLRALTTNQEFENMLQSRFGIDERQAKVLGLTLSNDLTISQTGLNSANRRKIMAEIDGINIDNFAKKAGLPADVASKYIKVVKELLPIIMMAGGF